MEIITGVERRRRWRLEEKLRIVAEVEQPGASFADVARRHEVSRGLLCLTMSSTFRPSTFDFTARSEPTEHRNAINWDSVCIPQ
jgi:hypothetical protein